MVRKQNLRYLKQSDVYISKKRGDYEPPISTPATYIYISNIPTILLLEQSFIVMTYEVEQCISVSIFVDRLLLTCWGNSPSSDCKLIKTFAARCRGVGSLSACMDEIWVPFWMCKLYQSIKIHKLNKTMQTCPAPISDSMAQPVFTAWARLPLRLV